MKWLFVATQLMILSCVCVMAQPVLSSPDGRIRMKVIVRAGKAQKSSGSEKYDLITGKTSHVEEKYNQLEIRMAGSRYSAARYSSIIRGVK